MSKRKSTDSSGDVFVQHADIFKYIKQVRRKIWPGKSTLLVDEYTKFMILKIVENDWRTFQIPRFTPSWKIDELWHQHLLFPGEYVRFCEIALGKDRRGNVKLIDHVPGNHGDRERRIQDTKKAYKRLYGTEMDKEYWAELVEVPPPEPSSSSMSPAPFKSSMSTVPIKGGIAQILVKSLLGSITSFEVALDEPVSKLKEMYKDREGVPVGQQRFIFAGHQLEDHIPIGNYNIGRESVVHFVLGLAGC